MFRNTITCRALALAFCSVAIAGCADEVVNDSESNPLPRQKKGAGIGEFDPGAGKEVVDEQVRISNPITGPLEAYGPLKRKVVTDIGIKHAIDLFHAVEGRYPKDFDEFMTKIIKQNQLKLPPAGAGMHYEYDVANHQLIVVKDEQPQEPQK